MRLNSIRERLVKARPQRGTAKAGSHAFSARSSFLTIRHDGNRRDFSWLHSGHLQHLTRTGLTFNSALPELAFAKLAAKCSLSSLPSSFTSSFRLSHPQSASTFCPPHYSAIMVLSAFTLCCPSGIDSKPLKQLARQLPRSGSVQSIFSPAPWLPSFLTRTHSCATALG